MTDKIKPVVTDMADKVWNDPVSKLPRKELERLYKVACYERHGLQRRLDAIRDVKDKLIYLLDRPTLQEHLEAGGDVMDHIMGRD